MTPTAEDPIRDSAPPPTRDPSRLFRIGNRGFWHISAHSEYGVVFTLCGLRVLAKDTRTADKPIPDNELCANCVKHW